MKIRIMRRFATALAAVLLLIPAGAYAQTAGVVMTARQIALYPDRRLLIAEGGVSVRFAGSEIAATNAMYDFRANTMTFAGNVTVKQAAGTIAGGGYVYDFAHKSGALAPNAVVPQLDTADALAVGPQVQIEPATSITFSNAQVRSGTDLVPAASYTFAVPPPNAKDFGYSPVPSAALEWPLVVHSGTDGYAFARMRYDKYNGGPGAGLEEHFAATDRGYAVFAQTQDVDGSKFHVLAYQKINDSLSQSLMGSSFVGDRTLRYAIQSSSRHGFASLSFAQSNGQRSDDLLLTGLQRPVWRLGSSRLQIDFGHDVHPSDWNVAQDFRVTPGLHFDTASVKLGPATFSGSFDLGESLYNYGRATLASDAGVRSTIPVNVHLQFDASTQFSHEAPPFPGTTRTYTGGFTWHASRWFNLVSSLTYTHDFDQAFGVGRPQYSASFDVTIRRKNGTGFEIGSIVPFGGVGDMKKQAVLNIRFVR